MARRQPPIWSAKPLLTSSDLNCKGSIFAALIPEINIIRMLQWADRKITEAQGEQDIARIAAQGQKIFAYETLVAATRNFHAHHKLGGGGFRAVYRGKLEDGSEIAVKKLSQTSNQGKKEFLNEAKLLARVQHRNVVTLLGYCAHGNEKLLVYEYVPHESLEKLLFSKCFYHTH